MNLAALRANLIKPSVKLRYKLLIGGVDRTSLITKNGLGTIRRDVNLSAGQAVITLNNAGGWFNYLHQTNDALRESASIQVYVSGDATNVYTLFAGTVHFPKYAGSTVTITIKDHNSKFLDKAVGSNESPATWYVGSANDQADKRVWRLLTGSTDGGGLDATTSPSNTAIDYASYAAWRDQHIIPEGYQIRGLPKGQPVGQLLMIICQLTHSYIWVNNNGKVDFAPPFEPGYIYTEGNTGTLRKPGEGRDLEEVDNKIINNVTVRYGYNHSTGTWFGKTSKNHSTSIGKYGEYQKTIEGRIFWHTVIGSAQSDRDDTITNYAFPLRFWDIITGFPGILEDVSRQITVSDTLKEASSVRPTIEHILYDLNAWNITMKARWAW